MIIKKKLVIIAVAFFLLAAAYLLNHPAKVMHEGNQITEKKGVYQKDNVSVVKSVYLTVFPPEQGTRYSKTFSDLNKDIDFRDDVDAEVKVLFQEGEGNGLRLGDFGYGLTDANGVLTMRGHTTRNSPLKSYKIELNKKAGLWNGFKIINLNKHPFDFIRIRNKLSFDLLREISGITSLRTNFIHLYVRDLSKGAFSQGFEDYGLYTNVENVDRDFLINHGLDPNGYLYKAEKFDFSRYPEQIKLKTDTDYNKELFEKILEIQGKDDHKKLIDMLKDVNSGFVHIDQVIDKHFDRDNYLTWLAVNILMGNIDTLNQNFYLYSPTKSDKWYFLPWDYDGAWGYYEQYSEPKTPWQEGISNYWGNVLHRRFLQNPRNIEDLNNKIESIRKTLDENKIRKLLKAYQLSVSEYLTSLPDKRIIPWGADTINEEFKRLPGLIEKNRKAYYISLEKPMPVNMARPTDLGTYYIFKWEKAFDFQGDIVQYSIDISKSPGFEKIIYHKEKIKETEHTVNNLKPGRYFWRLMIKDSQGHTQTPFDIYRDAEAKKYFGVQEFYVQ